VFCRQICYFPKLKTGQNFDIHIIAKVGHNVSIFSLLNDGDTHVRKKNEEERIPASHIPDLRYVDFHLDGV
jgi:hypothetical protein